MAADVAAQFMISASVFRRMVDWRSLLHKINIFRRRNKQNTQPHNGVQASGEYKIMDLVHIMTNFSQQNLITFIR